MHSPSQLPHFTAVQTLYMRWNLARPSAPLRRAEKETILIWGGELKDRVYPSLKVQGPLLSVIMLSSYSLCLGTE